VLLKVVKLFYFVAEVRFSIPVPCQSSAQFFRSVGACTVCQLILNININSIVLT